jgi:hypothetical protein
VQVFQDKPGAMMKIADKLVKAMLLKQFDRVFQ